MARVQGLAARSARDEGQGLLTRGRGSARRQAPTAPAETRIWPAMPMKKAGRHRNGQKVGDEAELEGAAANEDEPDQRG